MCCKMVNTVGFLGLDYTRELHIILLILAVPLLMIESSDGSIMLGKFLNGRSRLEILRARRTREINSTNTGLSRSANDN